MAWKIRVVRSAAKEFASLDRAVQRRIRDYLRSRIATDDDPRRFGKALKSDKVGLWAYRVGAWRIVCLLEDEGSVVSVLRVAHRRLVYE